MKTNEHSCYEDMCPGLDGSLIEVFREKGDISPGGAVRRAEDSWRRLEVLVQAKVVLPYSLHGQHLFPDSGWAFQPYVGSIQ